MSKGYSSIKALRVLGCTLPIEVYFFEKEDLSLNKINVLRAIENVSVIDLSNDVKTPLKGWALKPFSLLLSSFKEVILMDADTVWFQNPQILWDSPLYHSTGALFYRDRNFAHFSDSDPVFTWLKEILPTIDQLKNASFLTKASRHEQESSALVVNKMQHLHSVLATCWLNSLQFREKWGGTYSYVYGDKETFWLGWEMLEDKLYVWNPQLPKLIGTPSDDGIICSPHILHVDEHGSPLFMNGKIYKPTASNKIQLETFTHWSVSNNVEWFYRKKIICGQSQLATITEEIGKQLKISAFFLAQVMSKFT